MADGHGSFFIDRKLSARGRECFNCVFAMALSAKVPENGAFLKLLKDHYGGAVMRGPGPQMVRWVVGSKEGAQHLAADLRENPPRLPARKQQFDLWAEAVDLHAKHRRGDSWQPIARLQDQLRALTADPTRGILDP